MKETNRATFRKMTGLKNLRHVQIPQQWSLKKRLVFLKVGVTLQTHVYFLVRHWEEVLACASTVRYQITFIYRV
jgi:hypothetical protein